MRETFSAYKEHIRKQTLAKDKLCVITKSPSGKIIDLKVAEWIDTPIVEELLQQAHIHQQEYLAEEQTKHAQEKKALEDKLAEIEARFVQLETFLELLEHEVAIIKGEE
jgi:hypothetical protein